MSRKFNSPTTEDGLVQCYEDAIGADPGYISGNTTRLKKFTSKTKSAWDRYLYFAFKSAGSHQFDDSNHEKYPFIEADLVANQRDVTVSTDEEGALVLDIFKVMVKNRDGIYVEVDPIDQQRRGQGVSIWDGQEVTGQPSEYDKTNNGIIWDVLPDYSWRQATEGERGVKLFVNRESSYFDYTDTEKMPGCPGIHHDYFFIRPAYENALRDNLSNLPALTKEILYYEGDENLGIIGSIERYFVRRARDERKIITHKKINFI